MASVQAPKDTTPIVEPAKETGVAKSKSSETPDAGALDEVLKLEVLDKDNRKVVFGSLLQADGGAPRTIVVFIRHFLCGLCQEYVRALMETLPPNKLSSLSPATKLAIIGHGDHSLIDNYAKETGCDFPIYADPSRKVYEKLGFVSNLQQSKTPPAYMGKGTVRSILSSLRQGLGMGTKALSAGKISQNGGEMIFVDSELVYFHRMKNTTDHAEIEDLQTILRG